MDTQKLVELGRKGLIPGPDESDEAFFKRCAEATPISDGTPPSVFGVSPDWIEVEYSNKGLRFWEGGCTWIEGENVTLQLRKIFEKKQRYLGLYSRDELTGHEVVHVVRSAFEEPIFEEILAYQTAPSPFRRFFGPIIRSPRESLFFLVALSGVILSMFWPLLYSVALVGLIGLIGGGCIRLLKNQWAFSRTRNKLGKNALEIMLRLSDREITRFSTMSEQEISSYMQKMKRSSLRWKQLVATFYANEEK